MSSLEKTYKGFAKNGIKGIPPFDGKNDSEENLLHTLLALHIDKINFIASLIKKQNPSFGELFNLLSAYPDEIKFNKQLFIHRENPAMNLCFLYGISAIKTIIIPLFKSHFRLTKNTEYLDSIWMTVVEAWYTRLDANNLTAVQMKEITEETAEIIFKLNKK